MPTAVRSHAKINLGLCIGAPRADGFHALATVYQTLELHDVVTVTAKPAAATAIGLTSNDGRVPTDDRNTAWKMVELALKTLGRRPRLRSISRSGCRCRGAGRGLGQRGCRAGGP